MRSSRSSISRCVVTSRAVVGSSPINICGLLARLAASATLCRIPPESSKGYWRATRSGRSTSSRRRRISSFERRRSGANAEVICSPQRCTGLKLVNGFCSSKLMCLPRRSESASGPSARSIVMSSSCRLPVAVTPRGNNPVMAFAVIDLPEPDSPTNATVCPGSTCRSMRVTMSPAGPVTTKLLRDSPRFISVPNVLQSALVTNRPRG